MRIFCLLFLCLNSAVLFSQTLDLSGKWRFKLDPRDTGVQEEWFNRRLDQKILLPGSLQERGFGNDIDTNTRWTGQIVDRSWYTAPEYAKYREKGNIKVPFWLNPEKHYTGVAWYQRDINIPSDWKNSPIMLTMERLHWESTVYVDGKRIGSSNALLVPHHYVLNGLKPGKHVLTVRVDNKMIVLLGGNAHSVSDHTQTNWNGIVGKMFIERKPSVYMDDIQIYADIRTRKIDVQVDFAGAGSIDDAEMSFQAFDRNGTPVSSPLKQKVRISKDNGQKVSLQLDQKVKLWSEFSPEVYTLVVSSTTGKGFREEKKVDFGLREIKSVGTRMEVNGVPIFLRGTLECCIFPLTGYPATDEAYWEKIFTACKDYGLNHMRFHSWCPPEAAFRVADRMGFYLHVECGAWVAVGFGKPQDKWFYEEADRILKEFGNHPSFCMMAYGNEPYGRAAEYLTKFVDYLKKKDNRRLYTSAAGWPYIPNADYFSTDKPRIQRWRDQLTSVINGEAPSTAFDFWPLIAKDMPTVSHEIGQWCVFPDFKEIEKYTGFLKAKNFEIFKETLEKHHMLDLADEFLYASGRLQTLCYKADIEAALRTPRFAGFQLLDLHDFPGQGSALVGVLNAFWESKGYVDGEEYSKFCNSTVPLARFNKLMFRNDEIIRIPLEFSHFEAEPMKAAPIYWNIKDGSGKVLTSGKFVKDLPVDNCIWVGNMIYDFAGLKAPQALTLTAGIEGTDVQNYWHIWVYPSGKKELENPPYITNVFDQEAIKRLENGENVLLCAQRGALRPEKGGDVKVGFSSIFWNTAWTKKQAPHTLGIYCNPEHPALSLFPTEKYSDYQWWEIVSNCEAFVLDDLPASYRPIVHLIDDWVTSRKLGLLFEAKVAKGKLMVCGADFVSKIRGANLARNQFKESILNYMVSDKFQPETELTVSDIKSFFQ